MNIFLSFLAALSPASGEVTRSPSSLYDITVRSADGHQVALSAFRGHVLLIVNMASRCGFAKQIAALQSLNEKYSDKGLVILGFPSNDFMNQEPGTNQEILALYQEKYGVTFPIFQKAKVTGSDLDPLFRYLTENKQEPQLSGPIYWNFTKFLIDKNGKVIARFSTLTSPDDPKVITALEKALAT